MKFLNDEQLIAHLQKLVQKERRTTAEILETLKEVDARRLYLKLGFTSLFSYLTDGLGYSAASAQRRIESARLLRVLPELKEDLESGELNLMQISLVAQAVRQKEAGAALAGQGEAIVGQEELAKSLLSEVKGLDLKRTQKFLAEELDLPLKTHETARLQKDSSTRLEITLSENLMQDLARVKELLSHKHPRLGWAELISVLSEEFLKRKDPLRKGASRAGMQTSAGEALVEGCKRREAPERRDAPPRADGIEADAVALTTISPAAGDPTSTLEVTPRNPRCIPAALKRSVHKRDRCCQWKDHQNGAVCGSRFQLEIDHRTPVWAGGTATRENLQLLCAAHNRMKYRQEAGIALRSL